MKYFVEMPRSEKIFVLCIDLPYSTPVLNFKWTVLKAMPIISKLIISKATLAIAYALINLKLILLHC
jgi:hypothetical protein